ncbi:hypothetical protein GUJ93_ZPchr0014g46980 [Zizania palustris]|uniref:Uncharacterized protein n=1 Tax=Zizania palustris TaxID=103762 RepID=A0A8J5TKS0_ZIZPA|nr:hypothetical protein GUJ93_ZPchr0014g46980 [Zizania palustris]
MCWRVRRHGSRKIFCWVQEVSVDDDSQIYGEAVSIQAEMSHEDVSDDDFSSRARNLVDRSFSVVLAGEITDIGPVCLKDLQRILSAIQPSGPNDVEYLALLIHYSFRIYIPHPLQWGPLTFSADHAFSMMAPVMVSMIDPIGAFKVAAKLVNATAATHPPPYFLIKGFEVSLNRRDIWYGADMGMDGRVW